MPDLVKMIVLAILPLFLTMCSRQPSDPSQIDLVKVGTSTLTVREFKQIQDMSQDYYWQEDNATVNSVESNSLRLLNQVTEELLLTERAKAIGITINDKDLDAAVQNIKSDYPKGTFEQVLLENAVSYDFWKERLKRRILMDKVIEKELESKVSITQEEISSFYKKHYAAISDRKDGDGSADKDDDINEVIVRRLRKLKAEETYRAWLKELEQLYPVDVDWDAWKQMMTP